VVYPFWQPPKRWPPAGWIAGRDLRAHASFALSARRNPVALLGGTCARTQVSP